MYMLKLCYSDYNKCVDILLVKEVIIFLYQFNQLPYHTCGPVCAKNNNNFYSELRVTFSNKNIFYGIPNVGERAHFINFIVSRGVINFLL